MSRWVYAFESRGNRALTQAELDGMRQAQRRAVLAATLGTIRTVAFGVGIFAGVVLATEIGWRGWAIALAALIGFCASLNKANNDHARVLLYTRAVRVGRVEDFAYSEAGVDVRELYAADGLDPANRDKPYWEAEEEFMGRLTKAAGAFPSTLSTIEQDGAVLLIDGRLSRHVLTAEVADLDRRTVADRLIDLAAVARAAAAAMMD